MKKVETVIWGVIGGGSVCEIKSVPAMYKTPFSKVKSVMRRNAEKAADFAKRHNIEHWTTELDDLLNDKEINAIYIATPPNSHAALTIKAAKAGKAVYVEKPMANNNVECQLMVEECKKANVPLLVAYYRRALPAFLKIKELIDNNTIGSVRFVDIEMFQSLRPTDTAPEKDNWRVNPEISGGGYFHDLAAHQFDFLDFLFGPIIQAQGISANQAHSYIADDMVSASFIFENGVIGTGTWCFCTSNSSRKDTITIVGSEGELSFNTFGNPMIINLKSDVIGHQVLEIIQPEHIQQPLIETIVDQLRGIGTSPSNGETGARTTWAMNKITKKIN